MSLLDDERQQRQRIQARNLLDSKEVTAAELDEPLA